MNAITTIQFDPKDVWSMAAKMAASRLFGVKTPEEAFSLMMIAQAEGSHPAMAMRDYHVIQGRPSLKADAMLARFQQAGGSVKWGTYTDTKVMGAFTHPAGGTVEIEWTIDMAKRAGLANKDNWRNYPRAQLRARCVSEGIRTVYPACVCGVYTPEEVQDFDTKETVRQADVTVVDAPKAEKTFAEPMKPGSAEWQAESDNFDPKPADQTDAPADDAPADREVLVNFNGKGKPPTRKLASQCSADELGKAVELARKRYKDAKGEYADKNKAEAKQDGETAKEWAAYRASQQPAGDTPPEEASIPPETPPAEPVAATVSTTSAPAFSYAERLQALMCEAGYDGPLSRKQMAGLVKLDDTRLVDAMAGKCVLTADELTKLEGVGVNVKGLA